ncbi:MAG TPA: hypothetical protein PKD09_13115 [Aggregatilinea sp.]|uniref:hypothetical protein n=1 Tax=Aggregatilinea sp. TaxID=2806333 RepID=UPI002BC79E97|nr:hypothetical protein [Aggregatilinea sp.]HML22587.1 hypothetical protein [Aggregatilinea sp.]
MSDQAVLNYPDLLGAITGGPRLNVDVVQCALAARPAAVAAGSFFEIVFLVQNASDVDVDVVIEPVLPDRDASNQRRSFLTKSERVRIGLRPAEVGYMTLPVSTSAKTAPASGYDVGLKLTAKRMGKAQRVRAPLGGGRFDVRELSPAVQQQMEHMRALAFSAETCGKKNYIETNVEIVPPTVSTLHELKPGWVSLWTMQDYLDDATIAARVGREVEQVTPWLTREKLFMPLFKATQTRFQAGGCPLHPPEAIFIAKILTLILELGPSATIPGETQSGMPRWYSRMCHLLLQEPDLASKPEGLITQLVYPDLAHDAARHAFAMVKTVTGETFGTPAEMETYTENLSQALVDGEPLDLARAYLPLILGGLIANARVTLPNEQIRETVNLLARALERRRQEQTEDNAFVLDLADRLIERALETA